AAAERVWPQGSAERRQQAGRQRTAGPQQADVAGAARGQELLEWKLAEQGRVRDLRRRAAADQPDRAASRLSEPISEPALWGRQGKVGLQARRQARNGSV